MSRWAVMVTHPREEAWAVENAERAGYECFLPRLRVAKYRRGRRVEEVEPLFPRYGFVKIESQWYTLTKCFGVSGVIMGLQEPSWVPKEIVEDIRARCDEDAFFVKTRFKFGQSVVVERGPFSACSDLVNAIYQGMASKDRAMVLLNVLGKATRVSLREQDLVAA